MDINKIREALKNCEDGQEQEIVNKMLGADGSAIVQRLETHISFTDGEAANSAFMEASAELCDAGQEYDKYVLECIKSKAMSYEILLEKTKKLIIAQHSMNMIAHKLFGWLNEEGEGILKKQLIALQKQIEESLMRGKVACEVILDKSMVVVLT